MANFVYDILTDPAPLQVPVAGEESRGAVFIVVSNPKHKKARWSSIQVRVPVGEREDALTPDPKAVTASVLPDRARGPEEEPLVDWDSATGVCTLTAREGASLGKAGSMILALEGFPVSSTPGPVLLQVTEIVESDMWTDESPVTLSLLKQAPRVPRNFRPQLSLVAAGTDVVLRWDGPDTLLYAIQGPDGPPQPVPARQGGDGWQWSPAPGDEPKRDATYTLIATSPAPVPQQSGYFLTTTVHLLSPEFESVTATRGTHTPWVEGTEGRGKIYFTPEGAEIRVGGDASDAWGLLGADKAELKSLETDRALVNEALAVGAEAGLDAASGAGGQTVVNRSVVGGNLTVNGRTDIKGELHAAQDAVVDGGLSVAGTSALSDLTVADRAAIGRDLTVGGRADIDGELHTTRGTTIDGPLTVAGTSALNDLTVADQATIGRDLTVGGRADIDGELHTTRGTTIDGPLTVAGTSTLSDLTVGGTSALNGLTVASQATIGGDLTVGGTLGLNQLTVADQATIGGDLTVNGTLALNELTVTHRATIDGDLTVNGNLGVTGESVFSGKANANGHLSVRNGNAWILHTDDERLSVNGNLRIAGESHFVGKVNANGQLSVRNGTDKWILHTNDNLVAINANLRVHGAFHSDD